MADITRYKASDRRSNVPMGWVLHGTNCPMLLCNDRLNNNNKSLGRKITLVHFNGSLKIGLVVKDLGLKTDYFSTEMFIF